MRLFDAKLSFKVAQVVSYAAVDIGMSIFVSFLGSWRNQRKGVESSESKQSGALVGTQIR